MNEINDIKIRLFSVISTSTFNMIEFFKLADIRFDDEETNSAAISCSSRPELLLNKAFIEKYCKTNEHLFMLIMHELYHIILGHTHLFNRHDQIDNIAFDAIINAILCRMFPKEEYVSFFKNINSDESFPGCILRPISNKTPQRFIPILKNLYFTNTGTYFEVYELIYKELNELIGNSSNQFILLGNHTNSNNSLNNPLLRKILDKIISKWPREMIINGRDLGGKLEEKTIKFGLAERNTQNKMRRLLRKSGVIKGNISKRKMSIQILPEDAISSFPNYKDRTLLTKSMIYNQPLIFNSSLTNYKLANDISTQSLVYLDVSGSVNNEINHFIPLLLKPYLKKECMLFAFSTIVVPISYNDFKKGKYKSTGGTSIDCIFEHYFSLPKQKQTKKILILTDGKTGKVSTKFFQKIKEQKIEVYCGLFGDFTKDDMRNITKYFEEF